MPVSAQDRVKHKKLNQIVALLSFTWVFGDQVDSLEKKWPDKQRKAFRVLRNLLMGPNIFIFIFFFKPNFNRQGLFDLVASCA